MSTKNVRKGLFISFEGEDGSGKSTLIKSVASQLRNRGFRVKTIGEFSNSVFGQRLKESLKKEKFLNSSKSRFTGLYTVLADYVYILEHQVIPELNNYDFILKDRAEDTIIACESTKLSSTTRRKSFVSWIRGMCEQLPVHPDLTFYLDVPIAERVSRIKARKRNFREARANSVSKEDIKVFLRRDAIYEKLLQASKGRMVRFNNAHLPKGASREITEIICSRKRNQSKERQ